MATLAEIARKAGVSTMTASLVLNKGSIGSRVSNDCAARVRGIAAELGYSPNYHARSMKRGRADALAIAVDVDRTKLPQEDLDNQLILPIPYFSRIIGAFEQDAREHGMLAAIIGPIGIERAPDRALSGVRQRRFDGMAVIGSVVHSAETTFMTGRPEAPVVCVDYADATEIPNIRPDVAAAMGLAVDHLAHLGHRQFLYVGEVPVSFSHPQVRENHFSKKIASAGLTGEVCSPERGRTQPGGLAGYAAVIDLAQRGVAKYLSRQPWRFTAAICYNDLVAIGTCNALKNAGLRIPQDVSVIGFDHSEGRFYRPTIASVDLQFVRAGRRASQLLLEIIAHPERQAELWGHVELMPPILVPGESTGPMKKIAR